MKISLLFATLIATAVLPAFAEEETELSKKMDSFNDHYKAFRREEDPAKGAAAARESQKLVAETLSMTPAMLAKMAEGPAKESALATYRQMMGEVYVLLCKLEQAYLAKDMTKAAAIYEQLKEVRKAGHDKFVEEE
jgi:hypothetical protein